MMIWSIVTLFLCVILGVVSIIKVNKANNSTSDAERASYLKTAKILNIIGCSIGVLAIIGATANGSLFGNSQTPSSAASSTYASESTASAPSDNVPDTASVTEDFPVEQFYGTISNYNYSNPLMGIGCRLDESWTYADMDVLMEADGLTTLPTDATALAEWIADGHALTCMGAYRNDGAQNVTMQFFFYDPEIDSSVPEIIDYLLPNIESKREAVGISVETCERSTRNVLGQVRDVYYLEGTYSGYPYYEENIFLQYDEYVISVSISSMFENITSDIEDALYAATWQ